MNSAELEQFISNMDHNDIVNYRFGHNYNIVHFAVRNKIDPKVIEIAYKIGANIDQRDKDGRTPLHHAISENRKEPALILLKLGASTDIPTNSGFTATTSCYGWIKQFHNHKACSVILAMTSDEHR